MIVQCSKSRCLKFSQIALEMNISRRDIEKREIRDREISREKSGKRLEKSTFLTKKPPQKKIANKCLSSFGFHTISIKCEEIILQLIETFSKNVRLHLHFVKSTWYSLLSYIHVSRTNYFLLPFFYIFFYIFT